MKSWGEPCICILSHSIVFHMLFSDFSLFGSDFGSSDLLGEDTISQLSSQQQSLEQSLTESVDTVQQLSNTSTQAQTSSLAQQLDSATVYAADPDYTPNSTQSSQNSSAFGTDCSYGQSSHSGLDSHPGMESPISEDRYGQSQQNDYNDYNSKPFLHFTFDSFSSGKY